PQQLGHVARAEEAARIRGLDPRRQEVEACRDTTKALRPGDALLQHVDQAALVRYTDRAVQRRPTQVGVDDEDAAARLDEGKRQVQEHRRLAIVRARAGDEQCLDRMLEAEAVTVDGGPDRTAGVGLQRVGVMRRHEDHWRRLRACWNPGQWSRGRDRAEYREAGGRHHLLLRLDDPARLLSEPRPRDAEAEAAEQAEQQELQRPFRAGLPWQRRQVDDVDAADRGQLAN